MVINAGLTAGGANLLNLFDLRPGRALKVALAGSGLIAADAGGRARPGPSPARPVRPSPCSRTDLGERAMLGDAGANALGAMLGAAAAASLPRPARAAVLAGIVGLTAASEVVSFTDVIERTPAAALAGHARPAARRRAGAGRNQRDRGCRGRPAVGDPAANGGRRAPAAPGVPGAGPAAGATSP